MTGSTWWAPGRVNLIGEHTDYSGGLVLPLAIQLGTRVTAQVRDDGVLACSSTAPGAAPSEILLTELAPGHRGWASYVEGCAWLLADDGRALPGVDVVVDADLPVGAGLSSSASLVCATLSALLDVAGAAWGAAQVAVAARRVENEYVGAPVGVMDQLAVMHGRAGHALFVDTRSLAFDPVPLPLTEQGLVLLVVDTGRAHATAGAAYAERVAQCAAAARALGAAELRDVDDVAAVEHLADPVLRARARHVVTENARVRQAVRLLRAGQVRDVGPLLTASHASLRDDFEVSTPELDAVVAAALAAGALGARLTGAGFGGSTLVLVDADLVAAVTAAVTDALRLLGHAAPPVREVHPSAGCHRLPGAAAAVRGPAGVVR